MLWAIGAAWTVSFRTFHLYDHSAYDSANVIANRMFKAHALASLMLLSTMYLTKSEEIRYWSRTETPRSSLISARVSPMARISFRPTSRRET